MHVVLFYKVIPTVTADEERGRKMPYQRVVKVPLFTAAMKNAVEQMAPGISFFATFPLIESEKKAVELVTDKLNRTLDRYEYVSEVLNVEDTAEGWTITLRISGD